MKLLRLYSGREYPLADDEAEHVVKIKESGNKAFILLRCGDHVDSSAIESLGEIPLVPMRLGQIIHKDGWYMLEGNRVYVEDWSAVEYLPDPRIVAQFNPDMLLADGNQRSA